MERAPQNWGGDGHQLLLWEEDEGEGHPEAWEGAGGGAEGPPQIPVPDPADLELLYWRHFKERLAAHRKLQRRGVSGVGAMLGGRGAPAPPSHALGVLGGGSALFLPPQGPPWEQELEQQERGADCEEGAGAGTPNPKSLLPGELGGGSWGH